jgi:hypothetical protein
MLHPRCTDPYFTKKPAKTEPLISTLAFAGGKNVEFSCIAKTGDELEDNKDPQIIEFRSTCDVVDISPKTIKLYCGII